MGANAEEVAARKANAMERDFIMVVEMCFRRTFVFMNGSRRSCSLRFSKSEDESPIANDTSAVGTKIAQRSLGASLDRWSSSVRLRLYGMLFCWVE